MSSEKSDPLNDESDKLGSDSGSSGTYYFCAFSLCFDESVVSVNVLGSEVFVPTGVEYKCAIFASDYFYQQESSPKAVDSLKYFGAQIFYFIYKFENQFYSYSHSQTFLTHYDHCSLTKNMIRRAPMGNIRRL